MDMCSQSLGSTPRSGLSGSEGNSVTDFLRNCHTVFHTGCTVSYLYQAKVLKFPSEYVAFLGEVLGA